MRSEENNLVISYIDSLRMTDFVRQKEGITFEVDLYPCLYEPLATSLMYANNNLLSFMNKHTYNILLKNLFLLLYDISPYKDFLKDRAYF